MKRSWCLTYALFTVATLILVLSGCGLAPVAMTPTALPQPTTIPDHSPDAEACVAEGVDSDPAWSPDGSQIYYHQVIGPYYNICKMNADGTGSSLLVKNGLLPVPSPDGTMILFQNTDPQRGSDFEHFIYDIASQEIHTLGQQINQPVWSPDSQSLVYSYPPPASGPLRLINVTTREETVLTGTVPNGPVTDISPVWSPVGDRIAFSSDRDGSISTYIMDVPGGAPVRVEQSDNPGCLQGLTPAEYPLSWSPDGAQLAIQRECESRVSATLRIVDSRGAEVAGWGATDEWLHFAQWLPDNKSIVFISTRSQGDTLSVAGLDGSSERVLNVRTYGASLSPDGSKVAYSTALPAQNGAETLKILVAAVDVAPLTQTSVPCPQPVDGMSLYKNHEYGYCMLIVDEAKLFESHGEMFLTSFIPHDDSVPYLRITVVDAQGKSALEHPDLERARAESIGVVTEPENIIIGGEGAVLLDGFTGQDSMRKIFLVHDDMLYTMTFSPSPPPGMTYPPDSDAASRYEVMQALYESVLATFTFLR